MRRLGQPYLHDLTVTLAAPTQVWSRPSGDVRPDPGGASVEGVLHADVRVLARAELLVDGQPPVPVAAEATGSSATFTALLPHVAAEAQRHDPQLRLDRTRHVTPGRVQEVLAVSSVLTEDVTVEVAVRLAPDASGMGELRQGQPADPGRARVDEDWWGWTSGELAVRLTAPGAAGTWSADRTALTLVWPVVVPARGQATVAWSLAVRDPAAVVVAAPPGVPRSPSVQAADHRLAPWLERSLADLASLAMATPQHPDDVFLAAGAPWYLTLFGRDSIWAARMLLPVDLEPARGTLRTLARLQGATVDPASAEQPGKIPHELRRSTLAFGGMTLPPLYYGTIDATPLWVCLLHDAWRAGLPEADVRPLLPHLERALGWLVEYGDADGDGFLEYRDDSGHGLANQGWKDSRDSIRFADGRQAEGSVALCEVQGYAYQAAVAGAALLEAFGRPGGARYRAWAAALRDRFRDRFWCGSGPARYPALALDGGKRRVDALTSNIGHLVGTGLLDTEEELVVARQVAGHALDSGLGLRTMSARDGGYAPLSYHCGSVWPHDTAIVVAGLARAGLAEHAAGLVEGLLRASVAFGARLPELWSGEGRPVPYPTACRPQAWSAAAAVVVADVLGVLA